MRLNFFLLICVRVRGLLMRDPPFCVLWFCVKELGHVIGVLIFLGQREILVCKSVRKVGIRRVCALGKPSRAFNELSIVVGIGTRF